MSSNVIFQFESSDVVGHVSAVDTTRILVAIGDNAIATRICVGGLVAIEGGSWEIYIGGGAESFGACAGSCHASHPGSGL